MGGPSAGMTGSADEDTYAPSDMDGAIGSTSHGDDESTPAGSTETGLLMGSSSDDGTELTGASEGPVELPDAPGFDGFVLGADISSVQEAVDAGTRYVDTDGQIKGILDLLKNHGFNAIRLRMFVEPLAPYGYASGNGCSQKREAYNDLDHTIAFAQEVEAAGMGFLLDLHYSDTWADPGKQLIPEAWRGITTLADLAEQVRTYTADMVGALAAAGVTPDMVQVGNEITPGMLIHIPTANTDCYGNNSVINPGVNGSQNNWDNLATLLEAGIEGVHEVDERILVMLHIENTDDPDGVVDWVQNARSRGVTFDVLGLSAYEAFQGPSTEWRDSLNRLADTFPDLAFAIAEYNPERALLNDIIRTLPEGQGLGTFFWEPTQSGSWGSAMFTEDEDDTLTANVADFAEYDEMRASLGL